MTDSKNFYDRILFSEARDAEDAFTNDLLSLCALNNWGYRITDQLIQFVLPKDTSTLWR